MTMLESYNEVVRVADDYDVALCPRLPPVMDPQVEHVVEVDVGEQRCANYQIVS